MANWVSVGAHVKQERWYSTRQSGGSHWSICTDDCAPCTCRFKRVWGDLEGFQLLAFNGEIKSFNSGRGTNFKRPLCPSALQLFSVCVPFPPHWLCLQGAFSGPRGAVVEIDAWPFGSYMQRPTLIMSDSLGRLHKIIITQQWSELPHWHFHTTSDLSGDLWGHDQGQGSERAPLISQRMQPLLPLPPLLCILPCSPHSFIFLIISVSVCPAHSSSPFGPNWVIPSPRCVKKETRKSIGKIPESHPKSKCFSQTRSLTNGDGWATKWDVFGGFLEQFYAG